MVKIFTQMTLCCLLAGSAAIAAPQAAPKFQPGSKAAEKMEIRQQRQAKRVQAPKTLATRADELPVTDVITAPVGEVKYYYKNATGYDSYFGETEIVDEPTIIVFGENNEVYFQDLYTLWYFGTFTKGTINGNTITVELPQTADYYPEYGYGFDISLVKFLSEDFEDFELGEPNVLTYTIDEATGAITLDLPGEPNEYGVGVLYTDDGSIDGVEYSQEFTPVTDLDINSIPEGVEMTQYSFISGTTGYPVYVGMDDANIYIKGLSEYAPDGVVVAELDGNKATINQGQVLGAYYGFWLFSACVSYDGISLDYAPAAATYQLDVDIENNVITGAEQDYLFAITADPAFEDTNYLLYVFEGFKIFKQTDYSGTPSNPSGLLIDDEYFEYYGFTYFIFDYSNIGTNGNLLETDNLYYRIYVDDELYEFEPEPEDYIYDGLDEPTTLIPVNLNNGFDIVWGSSTERAIGLYIDGYTTLGVQEVYIYNDVETVSDIVTLNVETGDETTGIEGIISGNEVNAVYYNLNGVKVANPENGIFIKRATLSDGKVVTKKVVKK
ncbi:MAG: hypothetical protein J1D77_01955 [Muribaculaceae bacterium]|nr:hypothetical protein [Muribaculaceae bacterium]